MGTSASSAGSAGAAAPERAEDFIGAIGVNTHLGQPGYSASNIIADMAYLGLTNVRNRGIGPKTPAAQVAAFNALASAGLKFDWLTGGPLPETLTDLHTFLSAHPGSIATIEGPNEVNNFPISYNGLTGVAAAIAYQDALYAGVKADPLSAAVPVLDFTNSPVTAAASDAGNEHPYPKGGDQPLAYLKAAYDRVADVMPGKPVYFTEAGYFTLPGVHGWMGVADTVQAKYTLNLLMDDARLGVSATYLYDLIDDGTQAIAGDHFGLFTASGVAKPVAVAIHNLTAILADTGAGAQTFTPTALNYTISGLPTDGASLVIEKSSGVYDLVIWAEPDIWNASTDTAIAAPSAAVSVKFASNFGQAQVFDPLASASPIRTVSGGNTVTVSVTDHPLIIQLSNFAQAAATFTAPAASSPPVASHSLAVAPVLLVGHAGR